MARSCYLKSGPALQFCQEEWYNSPLTLATIRFYLCPVSGKMARLLLVHLETQGVQKVTIINRSPDKVIELRKEFPDMTIELELMDKMWDVIANSDVVYPSTAATTTIIDAEPLKECLKGRLTRPGGIQFIDISVPRNVHADCADIPGEHC